ncbi:hypothetical protein G7046_g4441 [Stylonectria norvegica]|nr:hypothetical protein G7046_g4441 [Stylonectria norvegica]
MTSSRVLRFARSDDPSAFVLVQITSKVKHDRVASLRVKNCPSSESEWQSILESLLNQEPLPDIQATATVSNESSISITIRKQTQGITQRLGAITLKYNADEAIELFEWCGVAVETAAVAKQTVADLTATSHSSETAVAQLKSQLEELLQAKAEDETALLQKFRDLLNEKKGSFNVSHPGSSQPSQPAPSQPARKAGKSRTTKRKAPVTTKIEEDSEDGGVQAMEVDDIKHEAEETDPGDTTEATASAASDDDDNDDGAGLAEPLQDTRGARSMPNRAAASQKTPPKKAAEPPPPPRALPFAAKKPSTRSAPAPAAPAGSDTESDDEL